MTELLEFFLNDSNYFIEEEFRQHKNYTYKDKSTSEVQLYIRETCLVKIIWFKKLSIHINRKQILVVLDSSSFTLEYLLEEYKDNSLFNISLNYDTSVFMNLFSCADFERFIEIAKKLHKDLKTA
ncbi:hypothetical protein XaC1_544 [Xanthomonas phage XaC1]|nr:hypothetical protein XaC1_544 [Xanthomonas phage XaC1]